MSQSSTLTNPFSEITPENLSIEDMVELFVPYPEYEDLQSSGHQFLNGHRGSGKSMMLRMMTPECQALQRGISANELNYFGVYLSIKATELNTQEYIRLENEDSGIVLSEHVLCTKVLSAIFKSVQTHLEKNEIPLSNLISFAKNNFKKTLQFAGWSIETDYANENHDGIIASFIDCFDSIQSITSNYIKKRSFSNSSHSYEGPLLGFLDVIIPIINGLKDKNLIPCASVYLLLDDADNLSLQQTKVLNTWVSYRTTATISLKISTQMGYKTRQTTSQMIIEAPHDYSEIYFTAVQTGSPKENYPKLVSDIVEKRLARVGITNLNARSFFPEDENQVNEISKIAKEIKENWEENGSGFRAGDDAYRWARPEYIRRLPNGYRYQYAGFDQLVHISSGIIRFFLDPAAKMFSEQLKRNIDKPITAIDPDIQDKQIRAQADDLFLNEFHKLRDDACTHSSLGWTNESFEGLHNLIEGLGMLFQSFLMDNTQTQRRTFSFFISDSPPEELRKIITLGIRYGYLYESAIGKKSGLGRTPLYVLTRRIAPIFKLDPIGFSNHLSIQSKVLLEMSKDPLKFAQRLKSKKTTGNENQPELPFDE